MKAINIYLNFDGNTEEAFNFYKSVFGGEFVGGINRFKDTPEAESKEEADSLFTKLSADGKIELAMQDMFWGTYFGMFTDKFGIQWMVNYATGTN